MFLPHYGFRESPFGVTPDPRYLYASETHREALASLLYGIDSGLGFMTLTAMPGMGKTTLLFEVLDTLRHRATTAFIFQPISAPVDLFRLILSEVGVSSPHCGLIDMQMQLNELLMKNFEGGKRFVVAIDEAQNTNDAVLEQVRMLSNFETSREKLIQIILAGQPQLAARLASPELLQLRQRVSIAARLEPFSERDTSAYVRHRLTFAGYDANSSLLTPAAIGMIAKYSEGIPRNINNLCFNALALGSALKRTEIGADIVREVISDLDPTRPAAAGTTKNAETTKLEDSPRRLLLSFLDGDLDRPAERSWVLKSLAFVSVVGLVIAFGFVYTHYLKPYRGSFPLGSRAEAASQPAPARNIPRLPTTIPVGQTDSADPETTATVAERSSPDPEASKTRVASEAVAPPSTSEPVPARHEAPRIRSVTARHGQSLYNICAQTFHSCNSDIFRAFLEVNPRLSHPNHLVPGQRIFIPPPPAASSDATAR